MQYFSYKKNKLFCENVDISKIAEQIGTPVYIYSSKAITDSFFSYKKAFSKFDPLICFAMKANSNLSLLKLLKDIGAGSDIVSGGELFRALEAGVNPKKIIYAGVGKTNFELESALKADILMFNTESQEEIIRINNIAGKLRKKACIAIRVNPDVNPKTHPYISTGLAKNKFGIDLKKVKELIGFVNSLPNIMLIGIHMHIGSQLIDISPLKEGIEKLKVLIDDLRINGVNIKYLNLGGGLGICYNDEDAPTPIKYIKLVKDLLKATNCKIILEPGRSIVGNAGILLTKVIYNKKTDNKKFIIIDAGMNDLVRPSLYGAYHDIIPVLKKSKTITELADVVGPICETGDFLARDRELPIAEQGEILAVMSAGAYGFSMSSNYNTRTKVAEVIVKGNAFNVIRHRETYSELIQKEETESIPFSKMSGTGNDFIIIDNRNKIIKKDLSLFAKQICDDKRALGTDGLILVEDSKYANFMMRIFNKDGSEAEMCGNGARCVAKYAYDKKIVYTQNMSFETNSGMIYASINTDNNLAKIKMQDPVNLKIGFKIEGFKTEVNFINTGVPHAVIFINDLEKVDVQKTGNFIRNHKYFSPQGTNVNFVKILSKNKIKVRTYERGVEGETLACGTGSTASALIYAINYKVKSPIEVETFGNDILKIYYKSSLNSFNEVYLEGSVELICNGYYYP
ncbi:diaminopimelate decarboxylase [Candidatus Poribacteria bacterium]|nr:diaminopimelate decarboxylase [Candidatus Poribacteria bacterium]